MGGLEILGCSTLRKARGKSHCKCDKRIEEWKSYKYKGNVPLFYISLTVQSSCDVVLTGVCLCCSRSSSRGSSLQR